jgi:hypothetical protein
MALDVDAIGLVLNMRQALTHCCVAAQSVASATHGYSVVIDGIRRAVRCGAIARGDV